MRRDATRRADLEVVKLNLCQSPSFSTSPRSPLRETFLHTYIPRAFIVTVRHYTELT